MNAVLKLDDKMSKGMNKAKAVMAAMGAAAIVAGKKLFDLAAAAVEVDNVTTLAFGNMAGAARDWAAKYAEATGSSKFQAIEFASDMGLMIKGMGFAEEEALKMATAMVELGGDMSSAKNVGLDIALEKIRAGLVGEAEPLRTMGVLLSAARVKQTAYAAGIAATGVELTEAQKVQARMIIIMKDSEAMHGDLLATQDSAANSARRLQNRYNGLMTELGISLLPMFQKLIDGMEKVVGVMNLGMEVLRDDTHEIQDMVLGTSKATDTLTDAVEAQEPEVRDLTSAMAEYQSTVDISTAAQGQAIEATETQTEAVEELELTWISFTAAQDRATSGIWKANAAIRAHNASLAMSRSEVMSLDREMTPFLLDSARQTDELSQATKEGSKGWFDWGDAAQGAVGMVGSMLGGVAGQVANIGVQLMSGNWMGAIMGGVSMLAGALKNLGGPDEAQLERRDVFAAFHKRASGAMSDDAEFQKIRDMHMAAKWERKLAETSAAFSSAGQGAGLSHEAAMAKYKQFQDAVKTGNKSTMIALISEWDGWRQQADETVDTMDQKFDAFFSGVTAEKAPELTEAMIAMFDEATDKGAEFADAMVGYFDRVGDAARAAYAEMAAVPSATVGGGGGGAGTPGVVAGGRGGGRGGDVVVQIDGREVARAAAENMPDYMESAGYA